MGNFVSKTISFIRTYKSQFVITILCFGIFVLMLFPYGDLSDLVTEQVAKATQNQVFVSFKDLGLNILPPGIKLDSVVVDSSFAPRIKAATLSLAPSISGLLTFKPGFVANFTGLFGGELDLSVKTGEKINEEISAQNIKVRFSDVQLKQITQFASLPIDVNGTGQISFSGDVDPSFVTQPSTEYSLELKSIEVPAGSIPTPIGPLNLPTIKISGLKISGRLVNGELVIEDSAIGQSGDFISGRIKGKVELKVSNSGGQITPVPGRYDLKLDLTLNRDAESQIGMFLSLFEKYKTLTGTGARYAIELSGLPGGMPQSKALSGF